MTTLKDYPYWPAETLDDVKDQLRIIANIRKDDISQIQNYTNIFWQGRTVGKTPSASNDVDPDEDKIGDLSYDTTFIYILVNNAGTAEWRRATLASW